MWSPSWSLFLIPLSQINLKIVSSKFGKFLFFCDLTENLNYTYYSNQAHLVQLLLSVTKLLDSCSYLLHPPHPSSSLIFQHANFSMSFSVNESIRFFFLTCRLQHARRIQEGVGEVYDSSTALHPPTFLLNESAVICGYQVTCLLHALTSLSDRYLS